MVHRRTRMLVLYATCAYLALGTLANSKDAVDVGVVNTEKYHLEVISGVVHVLSTIKTKVTVYGKGLSNYGFLEWMTAGYPNVTFYDLDRSTVRQHQVIIFVSPEYRINATYDIIRKSNASVVVSFLHDANSSALPALLAAPAQHVYVATLAPHVAKYAAAQANATIHWMLPSRPHALGSGSGQHAAGAQGQQQATVQGGAVHFAIQGMFMEPIDSSRWVKSESRRNLTAFWREVVDMKAPAELLDAKRLQYTIVGQGDPRSVVRELPPSFPTQLIQIHANTKYHAYYTWIALARALLPLFGSEPYYTIKTSSTLAASLSTGVPLTVTARMLPIYSFLDVLGPAFAKPYYLQEPGESTAQATLRLVNLTRSEDATARHAVCTLREVLNRHAAALLEHIFAHAER